MDPLDVIRHAWRADFDGNRPLAGDLMGLRAPPQSVAVSITRQVILRRFRCRTGDGKPASRRLTCDCAAAIADDECRYSSRSHSRFSSSRLSRRLVRLSAARVSLRRQHDAADSGHRAWSAARRRRAPRPGAGRGGAGFGGPALVVAAAVGIDDSGHRSAGDRHARRRPGGHALPAGDRHRRRRSPSPPARALPRARCWSTSTTPTSGSRSTRRRSRSTTADAALRSRRAARRSPSNVTAGRSRRRARRRPEGRDRPQGGRARPRQADDHAPPSPASSA